MNRTLKAASLALVAAVLLLPPAARAQSRSRGLGGPALGPSIGGTAYALQLALDIPPSGADVGPRVTGEIMYGAAQLTPTLRVDIGGRTSFAYHSAFRNGSLWVWDFVPDVRLIGGVTPRLAFYGDFGAGLAVVRVARDFISDTSVAATFQLGGGVSYALSADVNLMGEVRFDFYTRSGAGTFIALPTIGLQFH